jgi:hypothetical protein
MVGDELLIDRQNRIVLRVVSAEVGFPREDFASGRLDLRPCDALAFEIAELDLPDAVRIM